MKMKKLYRKVKWFPSMIINQLQMRFRKYQLGSRLTIRGILFIRGKGSVTIGNDVTINSCREANPIGGDTKTILYAKPNGKIVIGNNVGISNSAIVAMQEVTIGDDVFIGGNCKIYDHDFHSIYYTDRMNGDINVKADKIHIKKGAFIGGHVIVLKGVTIGEYSVVGAGSVVTKNIPNGELWAGNPARFIRKIDRGEMRK